MGVERYGSKTDVVVKLVLVFFIALLSFSVGTFVGKKFSDSQHKLAQLEPGQNADGEHTDSVEQDTHEAVAEGSAQPDRSVASVDENHAESKPQKSLSDDEIAKLAEEFVTDDAKPTTKAEGHGETHAQEHSPAVAKADAPAHAETHTEPAATPAPAGHAETKQNLSAEKSAHTPQPSKPAARMAEGHSPVIENPPAQTSRIPAALPKEVASSAIGKFTVQVAAFPNEKEAQTLSASLKEQGFSAFYVSAKVKKDTYYRVSIGLFTTSKEADSYMKDLLKRKKVESALVQKISSAD